MNEPVAALDLTGLTIDDLTFAMTPGGLRTSDRIIHVEDGTVVRPPRRRARPHDPNKTWMGEVARANWIVATVRQGGPIQDFVADIVVPGEPSRRDGQLLYVFTGAQDEPTTMILQPVLQWGAAGDPDGWHICSWLVDRQTGKAHRTGSVAVKPGARVRARIRRTGRDGARIAYTCEFEGHGATKLNVVLDTALRTAVSVLEAYRTTGPLNYPPDPAIRFEGVRLVQAQPGAWLPRNFVIDDGQHAEIVQQSEPSVFELHCR